MNVKMVLKDIEIVDVHEVRMCPLQDTHPRSLARTTITLQNQKHKTHVFHAMKKQLGDNSGIA